MRNRPLLSGCLIGCFLIILSVTIGGARFADGFRPSVLENETGGKAKVSLSGQIYDLDVRDEYQILYLKNISIIYQNKSFEESKIIIYDEEKLHMEIGNQVKVSGELSFYERERNPGNFNQKIYYRKQGIRASVWASEIAVTESCVNYLGKSLYDLRTKWKEMLVAVLGEKDGNVLAAMLLAEKSGMNEETKALYQANGIGHILAISGLHLSVIGIGLYKILRRLSGSFVAGGIAGSSFLILYILMIGMSVSVLRAWIMFLFRVGADMTGRNYDLPTALGVSAFATMIWNPLYLYDGGFWLSYGAILSMILVLPIFENHLFQGLWASVSIQLITLPVLLYYFYEIPLYAVALNLIVVPLMTVILICGLAGSCVILFAEKGIGSIMLKICGMILEIYEKCCEIAIKLPGARLVAGQPEKCQMIVYYGMLLLVVGNWWYKKRLKQTSKISVILFFLFFNIIVILCPVNKMICQIKGEIEITVLDVGQGDGIFIRGPEGNTYLIDSGSSDVKKVGQYRIEPFLKSRGIRKIDYVFVSHGDGDHINGIMEMLEREQLGISIETIIFPDRDAWDENVIELAYLAAEKNVYIAEMISGQVFTEGEMKLTCLAPIEEVHLYKGESNAASMVLALEYGEFDMLFTGDTEAEGEEILTQVLKDSDMCKGWDVLKVAHHGSKNSSNEEFLQVVAPSYSLISAGRENSYGHPHKETIERLIKGGSVVISTQENGAITIVTNGRKMKIGGYLQEQDYLL